ncbi:PQQ-dependent sugar dehydrogenase [Flavilitoribacter nigricans]|nr:PQQ-dependent sugar dehydrogenase [Flavilitoribacter nigricans]
MTKLKTLLWLGVPLVLMGVGFSSCKGSPEEGASKEKADLDQEYVRGEMPVQHGMELFNQYCASCHNFSENGIGPNLSGVTAEVDKEWLKTFIHNPVEVIESGDTRAVALFEKYQQYMPPFPMIEGEDLEDILGFIHKFSEGEKRNKNNRAGGLINPVADKIPTSDLGLELQAQFTVPASAEVTPITRINKMAATANDRLFLHDLRGKLYEVKNDGDLSVYLDLTETLPDFVDHPGKGTGFGSWAFHPDFEQNGLFYTTHNEPPGTATADFPVPDSVRSSLQAIITEWKADDPQALNFSGSHRELLRADMVSGGHGFQELTFNPLAKPGTADYGMLYLGIGDGGAALGGYPFLCDNNGSIWGSVIRIDPAGNNSANGQYGIPTDNPFVDQAGAVGEIWARGFRNPHRISWDEGGSGKMLITNIGQHSLEEVNLGKAGADYGWPQREGTFLFDVDANPELVYPLPDDDATAAYTYPVVQYDHDEGNAVSGGFVYNGQLPLLRGKYIFGDISRGTLFYSEIADMIEGQQAPVYRLQVLFDGQPSDLETITQNKRVDLRLGTDQAGELYVLTKSNGTVYKVVDCRGVEDPVVQ